MLGAAHLGELGAKRSLLLVAASGVVAWLSLRLVENPIRFSRTVAASSRLALSLGGNFSLMGALAGAVLILAVPASPGGATTGAAGARFLETPTFEALESELADLDTSDFRAPAPTDATRDIPDAQRAGCVSHQDSRKVVQCELGDPAGVVTVVTIGDSKNLQWSDALIPIAEREGWRLVTFYKSACVFTEPAYELEDQRIEYCAEWNLAASTDSSRSIRTLSSPPAAE